MIESAATKVKKARGKTGIPLRLHVIFFVVAACVPVLTGCDTPAPAPLIRPGNFGAIYLPETRLQSEPPPAYMLPERNTPVPAPAEGVKTPQEKEPSP